MAAAMRRTNAAAGAAALADAQGTMRLLLSKLHTLWWWAVEVVEEQGTLREVMEEVLLSEVASQRTAAEAEDMVLVVLDQPVAAVAVDHDLAVAADRKVATEAPASMRIIPAEPGAAERGGTATKLAPAAEMPRAVPAPMSRILPSAQ